MTVFPKKTWGIFIRLSRMQKQQQNLYKWRWIVFLTATIIFILDRCARTGNLECALIGLKDKNGDDLISHCVVSTYEYYEYKVLQERIGCDVREIIPPAEANVIYENGRVANADAMSEEFINNPIIKQYIDNPKCSVILFENPPFRDVTSNSTGVANKQNSFVLEAMRKKIKGAVLGSVHIKSKSKIKASEMVEIEIESSLS